MAYYRKRNGIWSYTIELPKGPNGERRQKYKGGFESRREAIKEATAIENEINTGEYIPDSELMVAELCDLWLPIYKPTVKITTYSTREYDVAHIKRFIGNYKVQEITKRIYQSEINKIIESDSIRLAKRVHTVMKMIMKYAKYIDLVKSNPTDGCYLPKEKSEEFDVEYLEKDELSHFLEATKRKYYYYALFRFLSFSGCRVGEALALTWADINENLVTVNKTLSWIHKKHNGETMLIQEPKTSASFREIYIDNETLSILSALKEEKRRWKIHQMDAIDYVFAYKPNKVISTCQVNRRFKEFLSEAGINKDLTTHSLRHTHASILAAAGVPLEEIQKRLGHGNDKTTREIYYHVTAARKATAMDLFANYMKIQ